LHVQRYTETAAFRYPQKALSGSFKGDAGCGTLFGEPMAATKLDGAGAQKMKTLEEAQLSLQTLHGMVERMGIEVKKSGSVGILPQQIKRNAGMLQGQLKGQFGMIADMFSAMILSAGRGGSEVVRLRTLREHVAQIRTALDMAASKVKKDHSVDIQMAD
jgi:hypothetical protein